MSLDAVILAGGAGTRLRPVVSDVPKPLAPVAGRPFIDYLIGQLRRAGFDRVVLSVGHQAELVERHFGAGEGAGSDWGVEVAFSSEAEPLGTAGALRRALPGVRGERFLAMNGDSFFDVDLAALEADHVAAGAALTMALAEVDDPRRFGGVTLDAEGWVTGFDEKPGDGSAHQAAPRLINGGLYIIERRIIEALEPDRAISLERDVVPSLIGRGLRGRVFPGYFIDIGIPEDYARAAADRELWDGIVSPPD